MNIVVRLHNTEVEGGEIFPVIQIYCEDCLETLYESAEPFTMDWFDGVRNKHNIAHLAERVRQTKEDS